ncbi:MAG: NB-ARC domain-containing protein, partial [Planctomycetia bacterium]|nr:NB-ARC domain-containing protein [Planctomycetia bacterium]
MNRLTGATRELLQEAILGAFSHEDLRQLTKHRLELALDHIDGGDDYRKVVFNLIEYCEQRGLTAKLVGVIIEARPHLKDHLASVVASTNLVLGAGRGLFQLPPSLPDFTGRKDELEQIAARLRGAGGAVGVSSALRGMGGVGKTKTAIEACWMVKEHFPDAQLFVELRGMSERPMTAAEAMARIIRDFHPEMGKLPDEEAELLPLYRRVLAGKKALILLDDAKDEAQVSQLLEVDPTTAFVVTSRNALALDCVESIRLGVLLSGEALSLLRGIVGAKGTDDELRAVAELCGFLPLALRVAGDFLRLYENWPLPKYIAALQDESKRLERLKGKTPDRDVEAVLGLSAKELVRENAELAARWQLLSVFPADFDVRAAASVCDLKTGDTLNETVALDELTALLDRSLVQYDPKADRYSLHDLLRLVARNTFENHPLDAGTTERIGAAERRFAKHYWVILRTAGAVYLEGET